MRCALWLALVALLSACGGGGNTPSRSDTPDPSPAAVELRRLAAELLARPEQDVVEVTVQHCLIAVRHKGPFGDKPSLSHFEAEERAAVLLKQALGGEDFRLLVLRNTYDGISSESEPGVYTMRRHTEGETRPDLEGEPGSPVWRNSMVRGFWMAAWRLQVSEIGIVEKSNSDSPFGYHIIKRLR